MGRYILIDRESLDLKDALIAQTLETLDFYEIAMSDEAADKKLKAIYMCGYYAHKANPDEVSRDKSFEEIKKNL